MPLCVKCNRDVCMPCLRAGSEGAQRKIVVASNDMLKRLSCYRRLAIATRALMAEKKLSRRDFPNWLADTIYGYDGDIIWAHGGPFVMGEDAIDEAFNDDASFRWISAFVQFAENDPRQAPQYRILHRLRLIELAFQIAKPDTARHFRV